MLRLGEILWHRAYLSGLLYIRAPILRANPMFDIVRVGFPAETVSAVFMAGRLRPHLRIYAVDENFEIYYYMLI